MQLTLQQEMLVYEYCINQGIDLQYGKLSMCDLRNFRHGELKSDRRYQVHSDDPGNPWSMIYSELRPAIMKFIELKKRVRKIK